MWGLRQQILDMKSRKDRLRAILYEIIETCDCDGPCKSCKLAKEALTGDDEFDRKEYNS